MSVITVKTIILKPTSKGSNNLTNGGGILKIDALKKQATLSLLSLSHDNGKEWLLILYCEESGFYNFKINPSLKKQELSFCKELIDCKGVTAVIIDASLKEPAPILQGSFGESAVNFKDLTEYAKSVKNEEEDIIATKQTNAPWTNESEQTAHHQANEEKLAKNLKIENTEYNDEAIAESNYFLKDDKEQENATLHNQNDGTEHSNSNHSAQEENCHSSQGYEASPCFAQCQKEPEYYSSIKDKLLPLFEKYPPISALTAIIPCSSWVKIPYGESKHYAVGTVKENNVVKYLCYGVPGVYGVKPKGFESYSYFIPLSLFDLLGDGYWCVFQEAESGKRVYCNPN